MLHTNININSDSEHFQYVIEYIKNDNNILNDMKYINGLHIDENTSRTDVVFINNTLNTPIKFNNHWYTIDSKDFITEYMPTSYKKSLIKLYFPQYSVDIYEPGCDYALTISTWIKGKCIIFGSYIINRMNALACDGIKKFFNESYYEYIEIPIIDPFDLIYSDDWKEWRCKVCNESLNIDTINSVGSILYCTLHPVRTYENEYIKLENYTGGQNSINLTNRSDDFLNLNISSNIDQSLKSIERPAIECSVRFNEYYDKKLHDYLIETYGDGEWSCKYELVVGDAENIYAVCESPILSPTISYKFNKDDINKNNFENGIGWKPGINIKCSFEVFKNNESSIYLLSNCIPFTERLFSYFVKKDFLDNYQNIINNVNLENVNMNILNINAVNKTENTVVQIERPANSNAGIAQVVFYRVAEFPAIIIHPTVNENVCINLDSYKHLVNSFILQIEGIKFVEIGRLKSGVIFKVFGNKLPKKISSGQYYILNQDSELVTSGKYTYEV